MLHRPLSLWVAEDSLLIAGGISFDVWFGKNQRRFSKDHDGSCNVVIANDSDTSVSDGNSDGCAVVQM